MYCDNVPLFEHLVVVAIGSPSILSFLLGYIQIKSSGRVCSGEDCRWALWLQENEDHFLKSKLHYRINRSQTGHFET